MGRKPRPLGTDALRRCLWAILFNVEMIAIASFSADFNHYTWWSQATFAVYALLGVCGIETYYFFFFQSLQLSVESSVVLMSYADCDTFEDTYKSLYAFEFVGGDFLMHWFPSLAALALARWDKICYDVDQVTATIWAGNAMLLTWSYFHSKPPPSRVVGRNGRMAHCPALV